MKKIISSIAVITSLTLLSFNASAHTESWYFHFALGYGIPHYPSEVKDAVDQIKDAGASSTPVAVDLGFYWPSFSESLIMGVSLNGMNDAYEKNGNEISIIKTGLYFSTMKTFSNEPGDGFFLRGDVGFPRLAVNTNFAGDDSSKFGFGFVLGGGYGFSFGGTRLLLQAHHAISRVEGDTYGTTSLLVGGLF